MSKSFKAFMKKPTTITGIVTALMFQLIFGVIWMTGYADVTDNAKNLKIVMVNEDNGLGEQVTEQLKASLPFKTSVSSSLKDSLAELDAREVQMVVHIPAQFSQLLQDSDQNGAIRYHINESNAAAIKSMMTSVANQITATVNKQAVASGITAAMAGVNVPEEQATAFGKGLSERVQAEFEYTNEVSSMSNQMIPMMMVLASYVGSMIMSMNLQISANMLGRAATASQKFLIRGLINVVSATIIALIASSLVIALDGHAESGFMTMWMFQSLLLMTFMFFSQIFLIAFGNAGMVFNIIFLSVQLVSSGAMVPRELVSGVYQELTRFLPATYAVEGNMNLLFGGPSVASPTLVLLIFVVASFAVGYGVANLKREAIPATTPTNVVQSN